MVTPDKDFAQLVSDNIFMYRPARMGNGIEIWGIPEVLEKFEIESPIQVIDYLGMMGDAVDNIPGIPGVGDKTAKKFLKTYGSIENLLENAHDIKGKLGEKIEANKEQGLLSKELAKIILDVPVNFEPEDYKFKKPDQSKVNTLFEELEFRRIAESFNKIFFVQEEKNNDKNQIINEKSDKSSLKYGQQFDLFAAPGSGNLEEITEQKTLKTMTTYINQ